ncbi:MAG: TrkH family potassium uptake protein [Bacteriovoracaceae bacterium]
MNKRYQKLPFLLELLFNGAFIFLYAFYRANRIETPLVSGELVATILQSLAYLAPLFILLSTLSFFMRSSSGDEFFRKYVFSLIVFVPMLITYGDVQFAFWLAAVHLFSSVLSLYELKPETKEESRDYVLGALEKIRLAPAQIVILSFGSIIFIGTLLLSLPISAAEGKEIAFIDAFFIATSATCVTGLSTLSLADNFSFVGQIITLVLFQIGGLGYMTLHSSMMILLGKSLAVKNQVMMQDLLDINSMSDLVAMIVNIIKYTLVIEFVGAIILAVAFSFEGYEFGQAIYYGFFHAISAFCHAGFSLFNNSLEDFALNPIISNTITALIFLGGLGFIVIKEVELVARGKKKLINLSVHSKVVFVTSFSLLALVAIYIFFSEYLHSLGDLNLWQQIQVSLFQSMTTRSSGFNTIPLSSLFPHTLYLFILAMFIGGNPGSCAGGIKTTTFAILFQSIRATLKGKDRVTFFDRTVPNYLVVRSIAIIVISLVICSFFILLMMRIETEHSFLSIFFETISAFATVGLSLGITPYLTVAGKAVIIILMFIGRIGPLTMALAIGQPKEAAKGVEYPSGRIMIG